MKKNKGNIFRGITAVLASTLCLAGYLSVLAFEREFDAINGVEWRKPHVRVSENGGFFDGGYFCAQ